MLSWRYVATILAVLPHYVNAQTVYMAGDSTMARNGGGGATQSDGWGQYLAQYLTIPVVNSAVAGRSSRSYTDEGRFNTLINTVVAGDFVIIEFGHNDGSSGSVDNGRQVAVGDGYDTTATVTTSTGSQIVIHTYPYYLQNAINSLKAKGAIPIISSPTPSNDWANGAIVAPNRFSGYSQLVGTRTSVVWVDHYAYAAKEWTARGQTAVAPFFPVDHTHTSPAGANIVAQTFVRGLLCGSSVLKSRVNAAGQAVPNRGC